MTLKKELKDQLNLKRLEKASIQIGKNGITSEIIKEITRQLEKNHMIKVKFLNNFLTDDLDKDIEKITSETKAKLVEKRGKTIILYKK